MIYALPWVRRLAKCRLAFNRTATNSKRKAVPLMCQEPVVQQCQGTRLNLERSMQAMKKSSAP